NKCRRWSVRNQTEDKKRRKQRQHRPEEVRDFFGARRNDVFFQKELDRIGDDLQQTFRSNAIRSESRLNQSEKPPLDPVHRRDDDLHNDERDEKFDERPDQIPHPRIDHRSTSPNTMSIVPISATRSETRCPCAIAGSACRFTNDGGRTRQRYACCDLPSLTM